MEGLTTKCLARSETLLSPAPDMSAFSSAAGTNHQPPSFLTNDQTARPQLPITLGSGSRCGPAWPAWCRPPANLPEASTSVFSCL